MVALGRRDLTATKHLRALSCSLHQTECVIDDLKLFFRGRIPHALNEAVVELRAILLPKKIHAASLGLQHNLSIFYFCFGISYRATFCACYPVSNVCPWWAPLQDGARCKHGRQQLLNDCSARRSSARLRLQTFRMR